MVCIKNAIVMRNNYECHAAQTAPGYGARDNTRTSAIVGLSEHDAASDAARPRSYARTVAPHRNSEYGVALGVYDFTWVGDSGVTASGTLDVSNGNVDSATGTISGGGLPRAGRLSLITAGDPGTSVPDPVRRRKRNRWKQRWRPLCVQSLGKCAWQLAGQRRRCRRRRESDLHRQRLRHVNRVRRDGTVGGVRTARGARSIGRSPSS